MSKVSRKQYRILSLLLCALAVTPCTALAQDSITAQALGKAHALEARGRMDLAKQAWQQVLLSDPNNAEALAGMARASKQEGKIDEANGYLARLRAVNPSDPNISKVENMGTAQDTNVLLRQAGQLSQQGQYARAMALMRQVYGNNPPPGEAALSYYQTEAATDDTRPQAVAGLRALMDKYPDDPRYTIALGKILTYNPRTRAEGRKLLSKYPNDPDASDALRQALTWDQSNPATAEEIRRFIAKHPDAQLASALAQDERTSASVRKLTPEQKAEMEQRAADGREVQQAYAALNAKRYSEAEQRFQAMLARNPNDPKALAGLGYVRMNQSNFAGAVSYLSEAAQNGDHSAGVQKALSDSRFYYTMREGSGAMAEGDINTAIAQYQSALAMRPGDAGAMQALGGAYLQSEKPEAAIALYEDFVRRHNADVSGWKGLFSGYASANRFDQALGVERRMPGSVRAQLMRDPDYLRTLASVYSATNHDAEAQRVLQLALSLPFPSDASSLHADTQMQYAALLEAAGRHQQAEGLYREVLSADAQNTNAWVGLVQTEHATGNDTEAYALLQQMPPDSYQAAMQQPGFATSVAAVYISQNHDDLAQTVLEEFLSAQKQNGQKPFVAAQVTLANLYLKHNNTAQAFPLFEAILTNNPDRPDAWKGLLNSLHATGHDQEALAEIQQVPPAMRRQLEADPDYLQTVGNIYAALGHPQDAMRFLNRAQSHYRVEGVQAPAAMDIQAAWLLFNAGNDPALYKQLMTIGSRKDLTEEQRRQVQVIWASWAVRRSQQALAAHNPRRAIAILNAAARAFPNNPGVLRALGSGYAASGMPKEAIQIFRSQDLSKGTAADYRAAVGAALVANDLKDAEVWLRFGLDQYPRDSQLLGLAARFETARGNPGRAADYYRASLSSMPQPDPGAELAEALEHAPAPARLPSVERQDDLPTLLSQPDAPVRTNSTGAQDADTVSQPAYTEPYLPSFGSAAQAPVVLSRRSSALSNSVPRGTGSAVQSLEGATSDGLNGSSVDDAAPSVRPSTKKTTLGDYLPPQSSVTQPELPGRTQRKPSQQAVLRLKPSPAMEAKYGPYRSFVPGETMPGDGSADALLGRVTGRAKTSLAEPDALPVLSYLGVSHQGSDRMETAAFMSASGQEASYPVSNSPYPVSRKKRKSTTGSHVAAKPHSAAGASSGNAFANFGVSSQASTPTSASSPASSTPRPIHLRATREAAETTTVRSTASTEQPHYVPPPIFVPGESRLTPVPHSADRTITYAPPVQSHRLTARERAEAIRANQQHAPAVLEGTSHPPVESYATDNDSSNAALSTTQYTTAPAQGTQVQRSEAVPSSSMSILAPMAPTSGYAQDTTGQTVTMQQQQQGTPGQQYPQPRTHSTERAPRRTTTHRSTRSYSPPPVSQGPMNYPVYPQPMQNEGTPELPQTYALPPAPTDTDLRDRNLPPLRGYFDPRTSMNPKAPLTERQQTQLDLALIESGFSNWLGGSVIAAYRSGQPGIDRLASLTVPFEVSFALGKTARLSLVPEAVFLDAGKFTFPTTYVGEPILGTLYDSQTSGNFQQFASGVGGELQLTTNTFAGAIGYTPYGFPVSNLIGRAKWRPGNSHFTLFGGRDAVKQTMLSYAGMRDPNPSSNGNIWGGVVSTGGGVRFDAGDEKSGLYLQADGADLTGYHVLENHEFSGTMGAYFRVATWEDYGSLNIGGTLYGSHYQYNERGYTYGLGGYFSPNVYFLASLPISWTGHWKEHLHYTINGAIGIQTFQEDTQYYFPLASDAPAQATVPAAACNPFCGLNLNSNTGLNYSIDSQVAYQVNEHWYVGGFLTGNNTNNYNYVSGGAFARYTFRPQVQTATYPTGLFPIEGFRPVRVP
ncbi:MAG: cellulose synthase subunit BcsC-related outer membrane protein [Acidobacteriaceae bacterium]|nr:cellulose synthase subunit BcsC-related outer membrane protein [Acidobacteriaceae bacterium]